MAMSSSRSQKHVGLLVAYISLPILLSLLVVVFAVLVAITCATTSHHPQAQFRVQPLMLMDLVIY
jgi:hypothetical protein